MLFVNSVLVVRSNFTKCIVALQGYDMSARELETRAASLAPSQLMRDEETTNPCTGSDEEQKHVVPANSAIAGKDSESMNEYHSRNTTAQADVQIAEGG